MKKLSFTLFFILSQTISAQVFTLTFNQQKWVDSVFKSMTLDEKVGQLIMPPAWSNRPINELSLLLDYVRKYKVGGFIFFQGGPVRQAEWVNCLQQESKIPLFIAMDAEWGLGMRLDSTQKFPYQMTLGASQTNDYWIEKMGREIARQCKRLGVHINFAPVVDVNNNPYNPVINFRSFGEDKELVFKKSLAYVKGMESQKLITSIKHFPGHGDTKIDSHEDLPKLDFTKSRLDSLEMYPFKKLISKGLTGLMVAHLNIPALDTTKNLPSTLSKSIITTLLKNELLFKGLIFSDAMNMKGLTKNFEAGEAELLAILAGNDIVEYPSNIEKTFVALKKAVESGRLSQGILDEKVKKILSAKAWAEVPQHAFIRTTNLVKDLNTASSEALIRQLTQQSFTLLNSNSSEIPILNLSRIASLSIGTKTKTTFQDYLSNYTKIVHYQYNTKDTLTSITSILDSLQQYKKLIIALHGTAIKPPYQLTSHYKNTLKSIIQKYPKAIYVLFGNPYIINYLPELEDKTVLLAYQENLFSQELAAQALMGVFPIQGKLPVSINPKLLLKTGTETESIKRLGYTIPESLEINGALLSQKVDSLMAIALSQKAIPGGQVLIAKGGHVIFHKAYGFHTYDHKIPTKKEDIYDLASVTKVSTSILALMKLSDEGKFDLNQTLGKTYKPFRNSNKKNLKWIDILTHQSGLKAWIPFWKDCKNPDGTWKPKTFQGKYSKNYPIQIADSLFVHKKYQKKIYQAIEESPVSGKKEYVYSDLSYYIIPKMVEKITGEEWETYLKKNFYEPLGAYSLTYNAHKYFPKEQIIPTEKDTLFRNEQIHGRVHDEGAALLGGVSGHAGLFGNANDVAKLMQLYLQKGYYGGKQYISSKTLSYWTSYPFPKEINSRRGIGFDKPDRNKPTVSASENASEFSFGHSGFTGTYVWIDPKYDLVYIFLSNRVYPTRSNTKLSDLNIRTAINQEIIECLKK